MSVPPHDGQPAESQQDEIAVLENEIQGLLEALLELGICASEVHPSAVEAAPNGVDGNHRGPGQEQGQGHLNGTPEGATAAQATPGQYTGYKHPGGLVGRKVQDTIQHMNLAFNAHYTLPRTRDLLLPHEVIDYVDQGRNPEIYTRELLERLSGENMYTNGIIDAVATYQAVLAREMKASFPDLVGAVDALGIPPPPSTTGNAGERSNGTDQKMHQAPTAIAQGIKAES